MLRAFFELCWEIFHWAFPFSRILAGPKLHRPLYETRLKAPPLLIAKWLSENPSDVMRCINLFPSNPILRAPAEFLIDQAAAGEGEAAFILGLAYFQDHDATDLQHSSRFIHKAAHSGHTEAQLFLAALNLREGSDGNQINPSLALEWIRRAANAGNVSAQESMAVHYDEGVSVPKNPTLAFRWYLRAALNGSLSYEVISSRLYAGFGVWRNRRAAKRWFLRALNIKNYSGPAHAAIRTTLINEIPDASVSFEDYAFSIFIVSNRHLFLP